MPGASLTVSVAQTNKWFGESCYGVAMAMRDLDSRVGKLEKTLAAFSQELRLALRYIHLDPASSLTKSRVIKALG